MTHPKPGIDEPADRLFREKIRSEFSTGLVTRGFNSITLDVNSVNYYPIEMIKSFKCKETEKLLNRQFSKGIPQAVQNQARRKW
jgi:hypothetical protein